MKQYVKRISAVLLSCSILISSAAALTVEDARTILDLYYVDEIPEDVMQLQTVDQIISALGDPYTEYYTAEQYRAFTTPLDSSTLVGIGIVTNVDADDNGLTITSVIPESPAGEAGLRPGDIILEIDGVKVDSKTSVTTLIRGGAGTDINLVVKKADTGTIEAMQLIRRKLSMPMVIYEMNDGTVVMICDLFGADADLDMRSIMLENQDLKSAWMLDLRSNPGGFSTTATNMVSWFVGSDENLIFYRDGLGEYTSMRGVYKDSDITDRPVIIMTDDESASASEMFSAAIRDLHAGIAVGQRTYGKGCAQIVLDQTTYPTIFRGDALKVTVYNFYSPNGLSNHTVGVLPTLTLSPENTEAAAALLSAAPPSSPMGFLKITLADQDFYISLQTALSDKSVAAFTELLEALPPSAKLYCADGMNWKLITPEEAAQMHSLPFHGRTFTDTDDAAILTLASHGLVSGYEDGSFRPEGTITRAEFSAMLTYALNLSSHLDLSGDSVFSDVDTNSWYSDSVQAMEYFNFISGYEDGTFSPDSQISIQELTAILANVSRKLCIKGYELSNETPVEEVLAQYDLFSPWARNSARILDELGALSIHQLPTESATRASAAQLLYSFMSSIGMIWE